jgi:hypothetical protein
MYMYTNKGYKTQRHNKSRCRMRFWQMIAHFFYCSISDFRHNRQKKANSQNEIEPEASVCPLLFPLSSAMCLFDLAQPIINQWASSRPRQKSVSALHTKPPCDILFWHARQLSGNAPNNYLFHMQRASLFCVIVAQLYRGLCDASACICSVTAGGEFRVVSTPREVHCSVQLVGPHQWWMHTRRCRPERRERGPWKYLNRLARVHSLCLF